MSTSVLSSDHTEQTLTIAGMTCAACQVHVQRALQSVPGVESAAVDLLGHKAQVTSVHSVDKAQLTAAVRKAGYDVVDRPATTATSAASGSEDLEPTTTPGLGLRAALSLVAGGLAMILSMPLMMVTPATTADPLSRLLIRLTMPAMPSFLLHLPAQDLRWTLFVLALGTMLFAAREIYAAAWRAARHSATNMNTLVALGTLVAFGASTFTTVSISIGKPSRNLSDVYFEAVVLILAFLLAGRWLEARARRRAMSDLHSFARLETGQARWLSDTTPEDPSTLLSAPETLLPLDALAVGDILRVLPGDRVPLDAVILAGRSSVDESMLTGEPLPVTHAPGDRLLGGTLNLDGALILRATAIGADSMLAQMGRLLDRARASRAPLQRIADRASAIFVPAVLALAALTFAVWAVAGNTGTRHQGFGHALSLAIAVLVIACPCAMGLAVPATVAVALGTAARSGLLFKGGDALERLATVDLIAFDKTGTLTEGRPEVAAFEPSATTPYSPGLLLRWANAVEQLSTHPLAAAIARYATEHAAPEHAAAEHAAADPLLIPTDGRVLPGIGAEAIVAGHHVAVGNASLLGIQPPPAVPPGLQHATPMYLLVDRQHAATFYAVDTLRPSAKPLSASLHQLGLRTLLLTGDTLTSAQSVATQAGIDNIRAHLLPADKLLAIEALQASGARVAMVGDGLNDAAALAQADAGIAVASSTDLAREAGHVLLLHHDLNLIPLAIRLARKARRLMRQNLGWAIAYNALGLPIAAGVLLPRFGIALSPALASAAMALSSVSVLLNSLRLTRIPATWRVPPGLANHAASRPEQMASSPEY